MKTKRENKGLVFLDYFKNRNIYNLTVIAVMTVMVIIIVQNVCLPQKYKIVIGEKSNFDINAPFDMIDELATEKSAREAADKIPPEYSISREKVDTITEAAESFTQMILNERAMLDNLTEANRDEPSSVALLQENYISRIIEKSREYGVAISREQASGMLISVSALNLTSFFDEFLKKIYSIAEMDITNDNINNRINYLQNLIQTGHENQNLKNMAISFVSSNIIVNVNENVGRTRAIREETYLLAMESKKIINKGARILNVDELITEDKYTLLADSGLVKTSTTDFTPIAKATLTVLIMSGVLYFYFNNFCKKYFYEKKLILQPTIIIVLVLAACSVMHSNFYAMPVYLAALLTAYLVGLWPALMVNMYMIATISLFYGMEVSTLTILFIGGVLAGFLTCATTQRSRFSIAGVVLAGTMSLIRIAMSDDITKPQMYSGDCLTICITCIISGLLSIGLIALFEGVFNTSTPLRLIELSSGNSHLLKRLSFEAPGTHHHSLMVGYMAEAAAVNIGANHLLARAGAYYHDVGKLKQPFYFAENQNGNNPHDSLPPEKSASILTIHPIDGVTMCEKHKLPNRVKNIVREHHGSTLAGYFYTKAKALYGEETINEADYRYPGPKPSSKESAIVMLADSCEAAVRSADTKNEDDIKKMVERIITSKVDDNQLDQSDLCISDISSIKSEFVRVLCGYYHSRVKYRNIEENTFTSVDNTAQPEFSGVDNTAQPEFASVDNAARPGFVGVNNTA